MQFVDQFNTTTPIGFEVVRNAGDFAGAGGLAAQLTVKLSKNGGPSAQAKGAIIDSGDGMYWLAPNPQDADTVGPAKISILTPAGYVAELVDFYVRAPSVWTQLATAPQNIANAVTLLQRLVTAQRA